MTDYNEKNQEFSLNQYDLTNSNEREFQLPKSINNSVVALVAEMKGSNDLCNDYAQKAVSFLEQADKGIDALNSNSNIGSRFLGAITGKTTRLQIENETMLANAQKACVQLIIEMNKQYLLSQEQALMMQCQIRNIVVENASFRQKLFQRLITIFEAVDNRFKRIEKVVRDVADKMEDHDDRIREIENTLGKHGVIIDNLELYLDAVSKRVDTHTWVLCIDSRFELLDNKQDRISKLMLIILEFFDFKNGVYSYDDLLLFARAMKELGCNPYERVNLKVLIEEFYFYIDNNKDILNDLKCKYLIEEPISLRVDTTPMIFIITHLIFGVFLNNSIEQCIDNINGKRLIDVASKETSLVAIAYELLFYLAKKTTKDVIVIREKRSSDIPIKSIRYSNICDGLIKLVDTNGDFPDDFKADKDGVLKVKVVFDHPFCYPPIVHIGLTCVDIASISPSDWLYNADESEKKSSSFTRVRVRVTEVSCEGFTLCIDKWLNTRFDRIDINWLAIAREV